MRINFLTGLSLDALYSSLLLLLSVFFLLLHSNILGPSSG